LRGAKVRAGEDPKPMLLRGIFKNCPVKAK
jgi:hypothetical protein